MRRLLVLCVLAGCDLYLGGGHSDDVCAVAKEPAQPELRDPSSNICVAQNPIGGGGCECGPCPEQAPPSNIDINWPLCTGPCDSMTEDFCQATPGCHAAYETDLGND